MYIKFLYVLFFEEQKEQKEQVSGERNFLLIFQRFLAKNVGENSAFFVANKSNPIWMACSKIE